MAYFSAEQFTYFLETFKVNQAGAQRVDRRPGNRKTIKLRHLHIKDFEGETAKYSEWAFAFRRAIRSCNTQVFSILEQIEFNNHGVDEAVMHVQHSDQDEPLDINMLSAELYDVLLPVCTNEALAVIRSVETCQGFVAWHRLYVKYNQKIMARAIRLLGEV